ncbi:MAG: glutamate formimidoyltransferase [Bacteroidales bacterium]|nr:glutamate formimidoyltransferase [Bacteroidales bacterium]
MDKIIECVPNFSEGRNPEKIENIVSAFRAQENVKLLDYSNDKDHNRMVVTAVGTPEAIKKAVIRSVGLAIQEIDLTKHRGQHPRIGAVDVIPFIPIKGITLSEANEIATEVGKQLAETYNLPVYLYEQSASASHRQNLASIRKGEFEGLIEKMKLPDWKPDFGPSDRHSSAGAVAVGARMPLIAFNVNLNTSNVEIADKIARKVRHIGGGLRYCKAMGVDLKEQNVVQVSMNLTDYTQTAVYQAVEMIRFEAKRYGVTIAGCELIGLIPLQAIVDTTAYYLGIENFSSKQILETHLWE